MRIAVSGTHCSGKSTLIDDFLAAHPEYAHEPEPYEWLDDASAEPTVDDFLRQLEISIERWRSHAPGARVIGERCPLDFVAYLRARGEPIAIEDAHDAMAHVDLLVILSPDDIDAPEDEEPALRDAMHEQLLELIAGVESRVLELHGSPRARLAALERAVAV